MTSGRKQSGSIGTTTEPAQGRFSTDIISWDGNPMGVRMESLWDLFVSGIMQKLLGQVSQNSVERWRTHGNFKRNFVPFWAMIKLQMHGLCLVSSTCMLDCQQLRASSCKASYV